MWLTKGVTAAWTFLRGYQGRLRQAGHTGATRACGGLVFLREQFLFLIGVSLVRSVLGVRLLDAGRILFGGRLLSIGQGFLDQAQYEFPLGELPAQADAFPLQVGLDPLEEFLRDLERHRSGISGHRHISSVSFHLEIFGQQAGDVLVGSLTRLDLRFVYLRVECQGNLCAEIFRFGHFAYSFPLVLTQVYLEASHKAITNTTKEQQTYEANATMSGILRQNKKPLKLSGRQLQRLFPFTEVFYTLPVLKRYLYSRFSQYRPANLKS